jgi:LCP family protein required for cell wall assembly
VYRRRRAGVLLVVLATLGLAAWAGAVSLSKAAPTDSGGVQAWEDVNSETPGETPSGGPDLAAAPETTVEETSSEETTIEETSSEEATSEEATPEPEGAGDEQGVAGVSDGVSDGTLNVLVLGVDKRPNNQVEGYGSRSDTLMIVQIEPDTGKIELLSIPRDMYVETEPGVKDKINSAYNYGGIDQARGVVENFTGVSIDHYAIVDFRGFTDVVDAMGGVTLEIKSEFPPNWKMEQGAVQTLDGRHALLYARYRGTPRADLERIERQQQLVAALRSQALSWQSLTKLPEYVRVINENLESDMGLEAGVSLGRLLLQHGRNAQMTSTQLKGAPTTLDNGSQVLVPKETENEIILQNFRD